MRLGLLLAIAVAAGCAAPAIAPVLTRFTLDASGCEQVIASAFLSMDQAKRALPPGFAPRDAAGLFGQSAPSGQAAMTLYASSCSASALNAPLDLAQASIFVEHPRVSNWSAHDGQLDFYMIALASSTSALLRDLAPSGIERAEKIDLALSAIPGGGANGIATVQANTTRFTMDVRGAAPPFTNAENDVFWAQSAQGLLSIEYQVSGGFSTGPATCTIDSKAIADDVGFRACPNSAFGLTYSNVAWKGTGIFRQGERAG